MYAKLVSRIQYFNHSLPDFNSIFTNFGVNSTEPGVNNTDSKMDNKETCQDHISPIFAKILMNVNVQQNKWVLHLHRSSYIVKNDLKNNFILS